MDEFQNLTHKVWSCKYHVVFVPALFPIFGTSPCFKSFTGTWVKCRRLALRNESKVEEGRSMLDHVHVLLSIPRKYAVPQVVGYIKGTARSTWPVIRGAQAQFVSRTSERGDIVNTVGQDQEATRAYIAIRRRRIRGSD